MNAATLILAGIVLLPIVLLMVLRVNAALVFLSLCLGDVLVQFVAGDTNSFISLFSSSHRVQAAAASGSDVRILLLVGPVVLTTAFMIHTVKGTRLLLNVLPAAGVGVLGALLIVPMLSGKLVTTIVDSGLWNQVERLEDLLVSLSALICLFVLWLQRPKTGEDKHHGKHHHG